MRFGSGKHIVRASASGASSFAVSAGGPTGPGDHYSARTTGRTPSFSKVI
jgi:hypothetical protein